MMKKTLLKKVMTIVIAFSMQLVINAQTVSDFESLTLAPESFWNGSDTPNGTSFTCGNAVFPNYFDEAWQYWAEGWAYSNMTDTVTEGFMNMYSAFTGSGYNNSANYAIGTQGSQIKLTGSALGKTVAGFYVTNGTFAALSMKNGDIVSKPFGGTTGDDPDWFKLTVRAYYQGSLKNDSVEFYLADYRFTDNAENYIIKSWTWVDLMPLGNVDSLVFDLSSSDNDLVFGMNTPAFFCIDNFTTLDSPAAINDKNFTKGIALYPNPASDFLHITIPDSSEDYYIKIFNSTGQMVLSQKQSTNKNSINIASWPRGIYHLRTQQGLNITSYTFIKQ